jgi:hypothetical protein
MSSTTRAVHGYLLVPFGFVVPRGDAVYSENAWGLELGLNLNRIRVCGIYYSEHRDRFETLGVNFEVKVYFDRGFDVIYSALEVIRLFIAILLVPFKFIVPQDDDVSYSPETSRMKLRVDDETRSNLMT